MLTGYATAATTEEQARARMNLIQWSALATRMRRRTAVSELIGLKRFQSFRLSKVCDLGALKQYLSNGWNTEALLFQNYISFKGDALKNSLVWAFPQAYYSVFAVTLAYFQTSGFTEGKTHASLIRKFGEEASLGHYPHVLSFLADGGIEHKRGFKNCKKATLPSPLHFDPSDKDIVDSHLCSLLSTTRQFDLRDRLQDRKLKTKKGTPKVRFTEAEYDAVAKGLGHTSVLSFLYRKRIKSNYQDIDSILSSELKAEDIFRAILNVVDCLHAVHEGYIARALGKAAYEKLLEDILRRSAGRAKERYEIIKPHVV